MTHLAIISLEHVHSICYVKCLLKMSGVQLVALAEPDAGRLAKNSQLLRGVSIFSDYRQMLRDASIDGVVICAATARHKEIVIDCARAGKAILCEKPIATTTSAVREMLAVCQAHHVPLGICFPARLSPAMNQARGFLQRGGIGKVLSVKATNRETMPDDSLLDPELAGGGVLMDLAVPVVVDALRWLLEAEFTQVSCHLTTRLSRNPMEEAGLLKLEMSNEVLVTFDSSWSRGSKSFPVRADASLTIVGDEGMLDLDLPVWTLNCHLEETGRHLAIVHDGELNQRLLENFVAVICGKSSFSATGVDGLRSLEIVEAAYRSAATGISELL